MIAGSVLFTRYQLSTVTKQILIKTTSTDLKCVEQKGLWNMLGVHGAKFIFNSQMLYLQLGNKRTICTTEWRHALKNAELFVFYY